MSARVPCGACQMGDHDNHDGAWHGVPGVIGGHQCGCSGDCTPPDLSAMFPLPAEGPAAVALTDAEREALHPPYLCDCDDLYGCPTLQPLYRDVERIVAARVADLTADLAAAREVNDEWRAMYERRAAAYFQANDQKRELEQALANVQAYADEQERRAAPLTQAGIRAALLPAAPTGDQHG